MKMTKEREEEKRERGKGKKKKKGKEKRKRKKEKGKKEFVFCSSSAQSGVWCIISKRGKDGQKSDDPRYRTLSATS